MKLLSIAERMVLPALMLASTGAVAVMHAQQPAAAGTQADTPSPLPSAVPGARIDKYAFIFDMAEAGLVEAELGKLAKANGSTPEIRAFGLTLVTDQAEIREELLGTARQLHVRVPEALDDSSQQVVDRLNGLRDAAFDRAFLSAVIARQESLAQTLRDVATAPSRALPITHKSDNTMVALALWSAHALPRAQHHATRARTLQARLP
jgi:putative membrane protein